MLVHFLINLIEKEVFKDALRGKSESWFLKGRVKNGI